MQGLSLLDGKSLCSLNWSHSVIIHTLVVVTDVLLNSYWIWLNMARQGFTAGAQRGYRGPCDAPLVYFVVSSVLTLNVPS